MSHCPLCAPEDEQLVWQADDYRVILVLDPAYPGFCRVVWREHVAEMTQLTLPERERLMRAVWAVEAAVREVLEPDKINLASLGNYVPHLHWHIIPRYKNDSHFPEAIWAHARRSPPSRDFDGERLRRKIVENLHSAGVIP